MKKEGTSLCPNEPHVAAGEEATALPAVEWITKRFVEYRTMRVRIAVICHKSSVTNSRNGRWLRPGARMRTLVAAVHESVKPGSDQPQKNSGGTGGYDQDQEKVRLAA